MTFITKKAWFAIPVSAVLHVSVFVYVFLAGSNGEKSPDFGSIVPSGTESKVKETDILVDTGWKRADDPGRNRGLRNQAAYSPDETPEETGEAWKMGNAGEAGGFVKDSESKMDKPKGNTGPEPALNGEDLPNRVPSSSPGMFEDQKGFSRQGSFQLSSYEWDYAPYMSVWIRAIQREWIEPLSYIAGQGRGGRVMVKVDVKLNGEMKDLAVIYTNVNREMTESAVKAVLRSFNRPSLPTPFPDSVLSVTFSMVYPVL